MFISEATVYGPDIAGYPLSAAPAEYWRKITITYPNGGTAEFIFAERGPGTEENFRKTVFRLQVGLPANARCVVTRTDGSMSEADTWGAAL